MKHTYIRDYRSRAPMRAFSRTGIKKSATTTLVEQKNLPLASHVSKRRTFGTLKNFFPGFLEIVLSFLPLKERGMLMTVNLEFHRIIPSLPMDCMSVPYDPVIFQKLVQTFRTKLIGIKADRLDALVPTTVKRLSINSVEDLDKNIGRYQNLVELRIDCLERRSEENYFGEALSKVAPQLRILHIRYRNFSWVFQDFTNLEELCIVWCEEIPDIAIQNMRHLKRLYLRDQHFPPSAFIGLDSLELFHFDNCRTICNNTFIGMPNLKNLIMSGICLNEISDEAFVHLRKLESLTLPPDIYGQCKFTLEIFKHLPNLKSLDAAFSSLLTPELFKVLPPLDFLDIRQCSYNRMKLSRNMFSELCVKEMNIDASYVYLSRADFDCLSKNGLKTLNYILDWNAETRFSPITYKKVVFTRANFKKFIKVALRNSVS